MSCLVVCVGSTKGGVGKSLISINLAAAGAKAGKRVLLVDTDEQKTSLAWRANRDLDDIQAVSMVEPTLHRDIAKIKGSFDLVIIDSGGRDDAVFTSSMGACDILVVPVLPSQTDVYAAEDTMKLIRDVNATRATDLLAFTLLNGINESSKLGQETRDALQAFSKTAPVMAHKLHDFTAYKRSLGKAGRGVVEMKNASKAGGEIGYLLGLLYKLAQPQNT